MSKNHRKPDPQYRQGWDWGDDLKEVKWGGVKWGGVKWGGDGEWGGAGKWKGWVAPRRCSHTWQDVGLPVRGGSVLDLTVPEAYASGVAVAVGLGEVLKDDQYPVQIHLPWADYQELTEVNATRLWDIYQACVAEGKVMGVFCMGGHGRTGTALSYLTGRASDVGAYPDVASLVRRVRTLYCSNAVESSEQIISLSTLLGIPVGEISVLDGIL